MRLKGKHHACPSDLPGPGYHVLKDRLMTEMHPVKVPEREDGLGIGSCIEGRQILDNLHRSSHCVSVWGAVRAVGRWGTITMPDAGRNRKARSGALRLKNALDIRWYSKYKTPFARRETGVWGSAHRRAVRAADVVWSKARTGDMKEGYEHTSQSRYSRFVHAGSNAHMHLRAHRQLCPQLRSRAHCDSPGTTARNAPHLT